MFQAILACMRMAAVALFASAFSWCDSQSLGLQVTLQNRRPPQYSGPLGSTAVHLRLTARIPLPAGSNGMILTPDGRELYISDNSTRQIRVLDLGLRTITHLLPIAPNATEMTIA